ncbi:MAG: tRNA epoxyqueuosine(34) reductase QueG [Pseudomonadales bacterium]|nr:tRNA epoxyqueuosine(34) reductase QueG [Pseudomonadales bacterium]
MNGHYTGAMPAPDDTLLHAMKADIGRWALELGFSDVGVTDVDLTAHAPRYQRWLDDGCHADMTYLARNVDKRLHPDRLVDGVVRAVVVRMDYHPRDASVLSPLDDPGSGYIARYALGRDYHKVMRGRLARLAARLTAAIAPLPHRYRVFTDSAPVLERALAVKAGLGWVGRHSLVLNREAGSWFFLGEILTDLPLPIDTPSPDDHCGACRACTRVCPTDAIRPDRTVDARRCVAWLTIENKGAIPEPLRAAMGNRIFGCDDCQVFCPWNRDAPTTTTSDFTPRQPLVTPSLDVLFAWTEAEFLANTEGTALRRVSYEQWQRNLAVALGNAPPTPARESALRARLAQASPLVAEHLRWALDQFERKNAAR